MTTVILFITTVIFALMAFAPGAAPIKTGPTRRAAEVSTEDKIREVATRFTENLITFDYRTIDREAERVLSDATQQFAAETQTALRGTYGQFRATMKARRSVSTGDVKSTALTAREDDTATVLVVSEQTSDNAERDERTQIQVIVLTLVDAEGGWKVDKAGTLSAA